MKFLTKQQVENLKKGDSVIMHSNMSFADKNVLTVVGKDKSPNGNVRLKFSYVSRFDLKKKKLNITINDCFTKIGKQTTYSSGSSMSRQFELIK